VEDAENLICMLEYNLSRKGYLTMSSLNGLPACWVIEEEKPDLVLLDIMLPGMDGWQICRIVRNNEREDISEIPIIMLTALGSAKEKLKGIEMGADDYISKPFSVKEVLLKVDRPIAREMKKKHLGTVVEKLEAREVHRTDFQNMVTHCHQGQAFEVIISIDINQIATGIYPVFCAILKRVYFKFRGLDLWRHIRPRIIAKTGLYFIAAGV